MQLDIDGVFGENHVAGVISIVTVGSVEGDSVNRVENGDVSDVVAFVFFHIENDSGVGAVSDLVVFESVLGFFGAGGSWEGVSDSFRSGTNVSLHFV